MLYEWKMDPKAQKDLQVGSRARANAAKGFLMVCMSDAAQSFSGPAAMLLAQGQGQWLARCFLRVTLQYFFTRLQEPHQTSCSRLLRACRTFLQL